jgi:hypothetical protein
MRYRIKEVIREQKKSGLEAGGSILAHQSDFQLPGDPGIFGMRRVRSLIASDNPPYRNQNECSGDVRFAPNSGHR